MAGEPPEDDHAAGDGFTPHPLLPQHPEFYRRVLEEFPSPAAVLDVNGGLLYANRAARRASGWSLEDVVGQNLLERIHPDELAWALEVYVGATEAAPMGDAEPAWGTVLMHAYAADGTLTPIEVTGANGLQDPFVQGLVYELRPAWTLELLERTVTGLAHGDRVDELLGLVVSLVSRPPLDIAAAIVDHGERDAPVLVATSDERLRALTEARGAMPWDRPQRELAQVRIGDLPAPTAEILDAAGYAELWCQPIEAVDTGSAMSLVALTGSGVVYRNTVEHRLDQGHDLARVVLQRARLDELMDHAAHHDGLTGLANRSALYDRLIEVSHAGPVGVIFIDLDDFKPVNDKWGHLVGDRLLQVVADRLRGITRPTDLVGRLGGDEFAVVIGHDADVAMVEQVGRRVAEVLTQPVAVGDPAGDVRVGASVGMAFGAAGVDPDQLLAAADAAMYVAKRGESGSGRVNLVGDPGDQGGTG